MAFMICKIKRRHTSSRIIGSYKMEQEMWIRYIHTKSEKAPDISRTTKSVSHLKAASEDWRR